MTRLGLIVSPGTGKNIADRIIEDLPQMLDENVRFDSSWEVDVIVDPLTGETEFTEKVYYKAQEFLSKNGWDYAIGLTDLPLFKRDKIMAIDVNTSSRISILSIPAFGWRPISKRIKSAILSVTSIMHTTNSDESDQLSKLFPFSKVIHYEEYIKETQANHNFYLIKSRTLGTVRLISGMTFANSPYNMMQGLSGVIAIAFATGAFGIIFSTMWNLSYVFPTWRLIAISLFSIIGMLIWIVVSHDLWEKNHDNRNKKLVHLYNMTSVMTLFISLLFYFIMLVTLFFVGSLTLLPSSYVAENIGVDNIGLTFYLELAWFAASLTTVASAIGAGFQNKETIQNSTYGYRQRLRYEESREDTSS